jgi:hypothetical protein
MSIVNINIHDTDLAKQFPEYVEYDSQLKDKYGEVNTPYKFISEMLGVIPITQCNSNSNSNSNSYSYSYSNLKDTKWLDAGAGRGNFSVCLFISLVNALKDIIPDPKERTEHIITNMLYIVELNEENIPHLREKFGKKANIFQEDYLTWNVDLKFDFIIGNPPYNSDGVKKVPTKTNTDKKEDGKTVWTWFIKKNLSLLKDNGKMIVVIPSIWMKPDKAGMYNLLLKYQIERLHAFHSSAVTKIFNYQVQTPLCYFLLTKRENQGKIELYDQQIKDYVDFPLKKNIAIPLCFATIVNKFLKMVDRYGPLRVIKTNMPPKRAKLYDSDTDTIETLYKNIKTTTLNKEKEPELKINYSDEPLIHHGEPKVVLAHKMYGFPYLDKEGIYGISARDNYIINNYSVKNLQLISEFLSTRLILFLFETTRYRMRYLEKYVFEYIPDFSKMPEAIQMFDTNNIDIYKVIGLTENEKDFVERFHKIKYKFFS